MERQLRADAADVLAGVLVFGVMEVVLAFRLRSLGQAATRIAPAL
jgi:hypothetical protein